MIIFYFCRYCRVRFQLFQLPLLFVFWIESIPYSASRLWSSCFAMCVCVCAKSLCTELYCKGAVFHSHSQFFVLFLRERWKIIIMCRWYLAIETVLQQQTYAVDTNRARFDCKILTVYVEFSWREKNSQQQQKRTSEFEGNASRLLGLRKYVV